MMTLNLTVIIYLALTLVALLPLLGLKPFTLLISSRTQPKIVQKTNKFRKLNLILNYFWGALYIISAVLASMFDSLLMQQLVTLPVMLCIGAPVTVWAIIRGVEYISEGKPYESCQDVFQLMPYGLSRRYAKAINPNVVVQFELSGKEPIVGYLSIKGTQCSFNKGRAEKPTTTIVADSSLWLKIVNQEIDPIKASIENQFTTQGNASIMLHLQGLFITGWNIKLPTKSSLSPTLYSEYRGLTPVRINKAIVLYSGKRKSAISKTLFLANELIKGFTSAGGDIELITLSDKNINPCMGCFHCWTETPGKCIYKDDIHNLIEKCLNADLVVFASPLYTFSVNGIMKEFMDRLIPMLMPYMAKSHNDETYHPKRDKERQMPHFLTIAAAGFPEIEGNFDGLRTMYKSWAHHMEGSSLRGELLLPAAELLSVPNFEDRKTKVAQACFNIGKQLVIDGCPKVDDMREISNTHMTQDEFAHMANLFWGHLDGKQAYMKYMRELMKNENE
ncbi:MAG: NAD(P)H-dependent oxidoreductase [Bacteroidales bacterium]